MIVKSISRKTRSFRELLAYISKPAQKGPLWLHNLPASRSDPESVARQLEENAKLLRRRRNGNVLYHEILSFSLVDGGRIDLAIAESVTRRYLELRAPYALAAARTHFNTSCPHVHMVISANELGSTDRLRITKGRFETIKLQLTSFVRERFPQLERSGEDLRGGNAPRDSRAEQERRRRGEVRPSRKQVLRDQVAAVLSAALSGEDCYRRLLAIGLRLYKHGSSIGIEEATTSTRRRYRLKTLGLDLEFERAMQEWTYRANSRTLQSRDYGLSR